MCFSMAYTANVSVQVKKYHPFADSSIDFPFVSLKSHNEIRFNRIVCVCLELLHFALNSYLFYSKDRFDGKWKEEKKAWRSQKVVRFIAQNERVKMNVCERKSQMNFLVNTTFKPFEALHPEVIFNWPSFSTDYFEASEWIAKFQLILSDFLTDRDLRTDLTI